MSIRILFSSFLLIIGFSGLAQVFTLTGKVVSPEGESIPNVNIVVAGEDKGTSSGEDGRFSINDLRKGDTLLFSHVQFKVFRYIVDSIRQIEIQLEPAIQSLSDVMIQEQRIESVTNQTDIEIQAARVLPSAFGDFNKILITMPGVVSNNELSSAYSVRGGNFDENLVYVNDIPVYRPFLANAGRQEGLSFVNPDLVADIDFYAGGWEAKYGDKLSSSLNIEYKEPEEMEGSASIGLLGGTAHLGGSMKNGSFLVGARHTDSRYLLNALETEGQYFPTYTDVQSLFTFDLAGGRSSMINKTKLNWLLAYSRNRYLTEPTSQLTDFGTFQQNFRLETAFQGRELLNYDTFQSGIRLSHYFNEKLRAHLIASAVITRERELFEVEGAYRLSDVSNQLGGSEQESRLSVRGLGSNYDYGRNSLVAQLFNFENRWEYLLSPTLVLEGGLGLSAQEITDELNEYSFIDSADFVSVNYAVFNDIDLSSLQYTGYLQSTWFARDSISSFVIGGRLNYWTLNKELLISPRATFRITPRWQTPTAITFSAGLYQQPPFYRELRNIDGNINLTRQAQKSIHLIAGVRQGLTMWGRPFVFTSDVYYKHLYDVIPYDIDNVRIRFLSENNANAFATGVDLRLNGEFIKGTQSWFSISYLQTREDIQEDNRGFVRRPTDQRLNLAVYFEDHMPVDPSIRVYLNLVFGSGFPFGPPQVLELRNVFQGDEYYRADLGLSKLFDLKSDKFLSRFWIRAEVLNALGADNTLSYTWIEDVNGNNFAIPNSLTARFLNVKLIAEL